MHLRALDGARIVVPKIRGSGRRSAIRASVALVIGAVLAAQRPAEAQGGKVAHIGLLSPADPTIAWYAGGLREGLRELGYIEGQNFRITDRWARGRIDTLPALAAELVQLRVDVLVTGLTEASLAARAATQTIPIIMVGIGDPVAVGLVASLAKPGGNVTGTSNMAPEIIGKQLQLLKEIEPGLTRVGVVWNAQNARFQVLQLREAEAAAVQGGLTLQKLPVQSEQDLPHAFAAMREQNTRAVLVLGDPLFAVHRRMLIDMIARDRLLAVSGFREFVEDGGLMVYAANYFSASKRAAIHVDKVLRGAWPGDLPVEQPISFEMLVNLKAARALGIAIPAAILARADVIID